MSTEEKKIKQLLPELEKPYVTVGTKKELKKIAEDFKDDADMKEVITILEKERMVKKEKNKVIKKFKLINDLLAKNKELDNDTDNETSDNETSDNEQSDHEKSDNENELGVKDLTMKQLSDVEKKLDANISKYNRYSKNNPMRGITWDKTFKKWKAQYPDLKINKSNTSLKILCDEITKKYKINSEKKYGNLSLTYFRYKGKIIIVYDNIKKPLFDIRHIIQLLNLTEKSTGNKYNEFKNKIVSYAFQKNKYDGYILREL